MQIRLALFKLKKAFAALEQETPDDVVKLKCFLGISSKTKNSALISINFNTFQRDLGERVAEAILESCEVTSSQRLAISKYLEKFNFKKLEGLSFLNATELNHHLKHLNGRGSVANVAVKLGSRSYPAHAKINYYSYEGASMCTLEVNFNYGHYPDVEGSRIAATFYSPPVAEMVDWEREPINLVSWLEQHKIVPLTSDIIENTSRKLERIERIKQRVQMLCTGPCINFIRNWFGSSVEEGRFGSILHPEKVIVDSSFEQDTDEYGQGGNANLNFPLLPLIRVFSLRLKKYVLVDVDDVEEYIYDQNSIERLVVPDRTRSLLTSIFSKKEELFADVVSGKNGGMVILANGSPGVGKTLTAEIMAEYTQRPLYVMELGELGTNLASVEESLHNIFNRVTRWNALLLFDEADIFLHKRDDNLERSAIVGIFLRLLDYFPGIMFLTTNRFDVIDHAVRSRVTIKLDYQDLDDVARQRIWKVMFRMLGRDLEDSEALKCLAGLEINGRQIRNLMRLAVSVHGKTVSPEQIHDLSSFAAK